jgi:hypothetical protein
VVGSNKRYAAIHQFGGQAGRKRRATLPARPYLWSVPRMRGDEPLEPRACLLPVIRPLGTRP